MREIKFRGKRKDNGEWVYGSYHCCNQKGIMRTRKWGTVLDIIEEEVQFDSHWILVHQTPASPGWDIRQTFIPYDVIPETVGQFTGLKDKSGNEIYEGDLIRFAEKYLYVVKYEDAKFVGYHANNDWGKWGDLYKLGDPDFDKYGYAVIGNIHDNKELLQTT